MSRQFDFLEPVMHYGTEPRKLARAQDPGTSITAATKIRSAEWEKLVFEVIRSFGSAGCISDDVRARFPGAPYSTITARYKALEEKKYIYYQGDTRTGTSGREQRVIRAKVL